MDIIERILLAISLRRSKKLRLEIRRALKALHRWISKHWGKNSYKSLFNRCIRYEAVEIFSTLRKYLESLVKLLTLIPIPKFCNGLIGVSLTDSVTAPAI
jgi:hypothetical protein